MRICITSAEHKDMPSWLPCLDWALLLLSNNKAQRGAMPTKLAEFFAAGVRLVQYGGNEEISRRVKEVNSGIVLDALSERDLKIAASFMAADSISEAQLKLTRDRTRPYFGLESGLDKYQDIIATLMKKMETSGYIAPKVQSPNASREEA
jgi:hypothetical protein